MHRPTTFPALVARLLVAHESLRAPTFGLDVIDRAVGLVQAGDLILVGGHPGAPVDALLLHAALTSARRGEHVLLVAPGAHHVAVAAWLLSTTGLPLDVIWERRVPEVVASTLTDALAKLPVTIVDGIGQGVVGVRGVLDEHPDVRGVVVLECRWLDAHNEPRAILFDLKRLARERGITLLAGIDTRYPGPRAVGAISRPDLFPDSSIVTLADVALLLTAPWIYEAPNDAQDSFSAAVIAPAARRAVIDNLRNPRRTMQILAPDATDETT